MKYIIFYSLLYLCCDYCIIQLSVCYIKILNSRMGCVNLPSSLEGWARYCDCLEADRC